MVHCKEYYLILYSPKKHKFVKIDYLKIKIDKKNYVYHPLKIKNKKQPNFILTFLTYKKGKEIIKKKISSKFLVILFIN